MPKKSVLTALVLLLVLLVPGLARAELSVSQVVGTLTSGKPAREDVLSWVGAATFMSLIDKENGLQGLEGASNDVMAALDGSNAVPQLDEYLPTPVDKVRFLLCVREFELAALQHLEKNVYTQYVEKSAEKILACLVARIDGYKAGEQELTLAAHVATGVARQYLDSEEGKEATR